MFRVQAFFFTSNVLAEERSKVKCSACVLTGHNRRNKLCPEHLGNDQGLVSFDDSDNEV